LQPAAAKVAAKAAKPGAKKGSIGQVQRKEVGMTRE
jgi:hypothetical protein